MLQRIRHEPNRVRVLVLDQRTASRIGRDEREDDKVLDDEAARREAARLQARRVRDTHGAVPVE